MRLAVLATLLLLLPSGQTVRASDQPNEAAVVETGFDKVVVRFRPPAPSYPSEARKAKIEGNVIVELLINLEGVPTKAKVVSGPEELRATSEIYAMKWRFEPIVIDGVPYYARFKLVFPFRLPK
jgi:protein TonB